MKGYQWNISQIVMDILKNEYSISYAYFSKVIQCSEATTLSWRNGSRYPQSTNVTRICKKVPELLKKEKKENLFLDQLKKRFNSIGGIAQNTIQNCESLEKLLGYLYNDFESDLKKDKLYDLIHNPDSNSHLHKIFLEKLKTNIKRTPIFQIEELGVQTKAAFLQKENKWNLNLDHCIILKFKTKEKEHTYKVLIDFNYNREEYENTGDAKEARDATKFYGVDMILLFSNTTIPKDDLYYYMNCTIYIEELQLKELGMKECSKDYIYAIEDKEKEILANQYSDLVLSRLNKYYSTIFKNILFTQKRNSTRKQQEKFIFWDAKFVMYHHINFQTARISELLQREENKYSGNALAIGFQSFPSILQLAKHFEHIYLLDNSSSSINFYESCLRTCNPQLVDKIHFLTFTSVLFEYMSNRFHLYHSIDFILLGTGEGSFIKKLPFYYLICNSWLKQGGNMYISFFNREFPYDFVDRMTLEENSEFIPLGNEKQATAIITNSTERYNLFCETYDCNEVKDLAEKYFKVEKLFSYPLGSILLSVHRNQLQNILKEYDKEYSKRGFFTKTFSNSRGYYIDAVLKKNTGKKVTVKQLSKEYTPKVLFNENSKNRYLKTLLLTDVATSSKEILDPDKIVELYAVILPTGKRLPETDQKEVCLLPRRFRFLTIAEINFLGLEYKNICPFLCSNDEHIKLTFYYDSEIKTKKEKSYYVGDGITHENGYKIESEILVKLLEEHGYHGTIIR